MRPGSKEEVFHATLRQFVSIPKALGSEFAKAASQFETKLGLSGRNSL